MWITDFPRMKIVSAWSEWLKRMVSDPVVNLKRLGGIELSLQLLQQFSLSCAMALFVSPGSGLPEALLSKLMVALNSG